MWLCLSLEVPLGEPAGSEQFLALGTGWLACCKVRFLVQFPLGRRAGKQMRAIYTVEKLSVLVAGMLLLQMPTSQG